MSVIKIRIDATGHSASEVEQALNAACRLLLNAPQSEENRRFDHNLAYHWTNTEQELYEIAQSGEMVIERDQQETAHGPATYRGRTALHFPLDTYEQRQVSKAKTPAELEFEDQVRRGIVDQYRVGG